MLTLEAILKTTRQMTAYGERGTAGALDHLPARVQGPKEKKKAARATSGTSDDARVSVRRWDDKTKRYVHVKG